MASIESLEASSLFSLKGKNAIVTGGSRGMGKEICRAFARAGCEGLVITSRKLGNCEELAEVIMKESPGCKAVAFACHVGKWEECEALYEFAYAQFGHIDGKLSVLSITCFPKRQCAHLVVARFSTHQQCGWLPPLPKPQGNQREGRPMVSHRYIYVRAFFPSTSTASLA